MLNSGPSTRPPLPAGDSTDSTLPLPSSILAMEVAEQGDSAAMTAAKDLTAGYVRNLGSASQAAPALTPPRCRYLVSLEKWWSTRSTP